MTKRNSDFPYLAPVAIPRELPNGLPQTVYQPQKSREWQAVFARIDASKTYLSGKK